MYDWFTDLYRSFVNDRNKNGKDKHKRCEEIAILEVLNYTGETLEASAIISPYLKLADIKNYCSQVLEHLNAEFVSVNPTRLKERLLQLNTNLEAIPHRKEAFISFRDDLVAAIKFSDYTNSDGKLKSVIKTSPISRNEIFKIEQHFNGSFTDHKAESTTS